MKYLSSSKDFHQLSIALISLIIVLTLTWNLISVTSAAIVFEDDFESGDLSNWTSTQVDSGTTLEVIAGAAKNGTYGLHSTTFGATLDASQVRKDISASAVTQLYVRMWFKAVQDQENGNHKLIVGLDKAQDQAYNAEAGWGVRSHADWGGNDRLYSLNGGWGASSTPHVVVTGTWYCLEIYAFEGSSSDGGFKVWVDGVEEINKTSLTVLELDWIKVGIASANGVDADYYFDDVFSDDTTTASQYSALGNDCIDTGTPPATPTPTNIPQGSIVFSRPKKF